MESPGGSSTASSRDNSPCRELSPLVNSLKPPVIIRRGPTGFGFTVHTIRVYYGDTDFYTMHHLVMVNISVNIVTLRKIAPRCQMSYSKWLCFNNNKKQ